MTLKVWHLDPAQITPYYNIAVCEALADAGCSVRYFTSQFLYDTAVTGTKIKGENYYFRGLGHQWLLRYPRLRRILRGIAYPIGHMRFLREVRRERPDIVHIQWSRVPRFDLWLIRRIQAMGIPVVHTVHDVIPIFSTDGSSQPLENVYKTVDKLIVHTEANKKDFLKVYPQILEDRIHIVPHVELIDVEIPSFAHKENARRLLNLPLEALIIGFFGAIRHYKGLDVLLEAFEIARQKKTELHLLIGGKIDPLEQDKLPSIQRMTGIPNLHLFEGYIPTSDVWKYHLAPDIYVLPYRHIYQSGALITAMGFGCPIIATDIGGMPEAIDGNGWILPPENPSALAEIILEAASDKSRLADMSLRSRELIKERHAKPIVARALIDIYTKLIF